MRNTKQFEINNIDNIVIGSQIQEALSLHQLNVLYDSDRTMNTVLIKSLDNGFELNLTYSKICLNTDLNGKRIGISIMSSRMPIISIASQSINNIIYSTDDRLVTIFLDKNIKPLLDYSDKSMLRFEELKNKTVGFDKVFKALKEGHKAKRLNWEGYFKVNFPKKEEKINYPYIYAVCKDGEIVPASINNIDLFKEDWIIFD